MINHFALQPSWPPLRSARIWPGDPGEMPPVCAAEELILVLQVVASFYTNHGLFVSHV